MKIKNLTMFLALGLLGLATVACGFTALEPQFETLQSIDIGQQIIQDNYGNYQIESATIFDEFKEGYVVYSSKQGIKRLIFTLDIKNLTPNETKVENFIKIKVNYQDNFKYLITNYIKSGETNLLGASLTPLQNTKIYCIVEIPDDVALSKDSLQVTIELGKEKYKYVGSIESAYEYVKIMRQINAKSDDVFWEISNISSDMSFVISPQQSDLIKFAQRFGLQKQELSDLSSQIVSIPSIPIQYQEGHQNYLKGINLLIEALTYASDESVISNDFSSYSNNLKTSGRMISESGTYIDKAKEMLNFLSW